MDIIQKSRHPGLELSSITFWRGRRGFTVTRLSELTGIPISNLEKWEGRAILPGDQDLAKLCKAFNCREAQLLTYNFHPEF